jgi:RIO kinase 1
MIELGPQLVKGGWCQILAIQGRPDLCAKVLIPKRRFRGELPEPDRIVSEKYGISDFLEYEWRNYQKIMSACPEDLRRHFVSMHGIEPTTDGRRARVMEKVLDDRGEIAPSLVRNTRPLETRFRETLERIRREVFLAHSIDHFGIVRRNILVRAPGDPVFIDFQTGRERFRGQFWLRIPWFVRRIINRCFRKQYTEMGVSPKF